MFGAVERIVAWQQGPNEDDAAAKVAHRFCAPTMCPLSHFLFSSVILRVAAKTRTGKSIH